MQRSLDPMQHSPDPMQHFLGHLKIVFWQFHLTGWMNLNNIFTVLPLIVCHFCQALTKARELDLLSSSHQSQRAGLINPHSWPQHQHLQRPKKKDIFISANFLIWRPRQILTKVYTNFAHTLHTLCTHFAHKLYILYKHFAHTLCTLCTHSDHTLHTLHTLCTYFTQTLH